MASVMANPKPSTKVVGVKALTVLEFAVKYRVSVTKLYELWKQRKGPPRMRIGRRVLIPVEGAEKWFLEQQQVDITVEAE